MRQAAMNNLLVNCARLSPGEKLLIISEDGATYYDRAAAEAVLEAAKALGVIAWLRETRFSPEPETCGDISTLMAEADCTIFFARIGDQLRFSAMPSGGRAVVSYALDLDTLISPFGAAHYGAFTALKSLIDRMLAGAEEIRVTCPRGTDFSGPGFGWREAGDTSLIRFPMSVFAPAPAAGFSGRAALAGFLAGTGSRYYAPYGMAFSRVLFAHFAAGRLTGFTGDEADIRAANAHYDDISARYGLDRDCVHSWHAGIHPGCAFHADADSDYQRWSGSAFGNPRILHFHTCGESAPGEISWTVLDPTITIDGVKIWEDGRLYPERAPGGAILAAYPCAARLFQNPERRVGFDGDLLRRISA